eukprot:scaffold312976_cov48-Tisochrysis_lutea.AAC.1
MGISASSVRTTGTVHTAKTNSTRGGLMAVRLATWAVKKLGVLAPQFLKDAAIQALNAGARGRSGARKSLPCSKTRTSVLWPLRDVPGPRRHIRHNP